MTCADCGADNRAERRWCHACGARLIPQVCPACAFSAGAPTGMWSTFATACRMSASVRAVSPLVPHLRGDGAAKATRTVEDGFEDSPVSADTGAAGRGCTVPGAAPWPHYRVEETHSRTKPLPTWFAPCTVGVESILAAEVEAAGAREVAAAPGGVHFEGNHRVGATLCLWSRVATRVLEQLARGPVSDPDGLYDLAASVDWARLMARDQTLAVHSSLVRSPFSHGKFAAQRVKDAVVDTLRDDRGRRPSVDLRDPDLPLKLVVKDREARLYRDWCGASLHKRGWRPVQVKSPLNEAIAAGLIQLSGWDRRSPLVDPMCGSGTFLIEAAHLAGDRAPGLGRSFAFERWPDHDPGAWRALVEAAQARAVAGRTAIPPLQGADRHPGAIDIARASARRAGVAGQVRLEHCALDRFRPEPPPAWILVNPPWGQRVGEGADLQRSWADLGEFLKSCPGAEAWVLSGDPSLTRHLRLRTDRRVPVRTGPVDCRFLRYRIRARRSPGT